MKQFLHRSTFLSANKEYAEERKEYANSSDNHWCDDIAELQLCAEVSRSTQSGCRKDRTAIRLIKVGTHTSHITYVVAYVISYGSRVARVILRNVSLHLTYDVGTHVSCLGVYTTTHTSKESLGRSTHTKGKHGGSDGDETADTSSIEHHKPDGDIEQTETYHRQTHYGT